MPATIWCLSPHLLGNEVCQLLLLRSAHQLQAVCCALLQAQSMLSIQLHARSVKIDKSAGLSICLESTSWHLPWKGACSGS